jgi:hypothetical protein
MANVRQHWIARTGKYKPKRRRPVIGDRLTFNNQEPQLERERAWTVIGVGKTHVILTTWTPDGESWPVPLRWPRFRELDPIWPMPVSRAS